MEPSASPTTATPPATPPGLAEQLAAFLAAQSKPAAPVTPPPAVPAAAATTVPAAAPADVREWLGQLQAKLDGQEKAAKAKADNDALAQLQADAESRLGKADLAAFRDSLEKLTGYHKQQLTQRETAAQQLREQLNATVAKSTIAEAVAGVKWANGHAAKDGLAKLQSRFEVAAGPDGSPTVREKGTGRPVADVVTEAVASEEYAHLLDPGYRGQGGLGGGHSPATVRGPQGGPGDVVGQIKAAVEAQKAAWSSTGLGVSKFW